jgi:hypothetical protein
MQVFRYVQVHRKVRQGAIVGKETESTTVLQHGKFLKHKTGDAPHHFRQFSGVKNEANTGS